MPLPFSHDAFLDVFGVYNAQLWSFVAGFWLLTAVLVFQWARQGRVPGRGPLSLMAVHWAWSGAVYHLVFFRPINPAATIFAAAFVAEACLLAWLAWRRPTQSVFGWHPRGVLGAALVLYGLAYPFVGLLLGLEYPRLPLFAVPCPTTLVTAGLLIVTPGLPRVVHLVPALWAVVGGSAAIALGIRADAALVVAAVALVADAMRPSMLGPYDGRVRRLPAVRASA